MYPPGEDTWAQILHELVLFSVHYKVSDMVESLIITHSEAERFIHHYSRKNAHII